MLERNRQRMIAGINELTGRTNCGEAVLLQKWSPQVMAASLAVSMIAAFAITAF